VFVTSLVVRTVLTVTRIVTAFANVPAIQSADALIKELVESPLIMAVPKRTASAEALMLVAIVV